MNDLIFDCGWRKPINFYFQNKEYTIDLVFESQEEQQVLDIQKNIFKNFEDNKIEYGQKIEKILQDYVSKFEIKNPKVIPKTLLIDRMGKLGLLCDCSWDKENGIAIVLEPALYITVQDDFL